MEENKNVQIILNWIEKQIVIYKNFSPNKQLLTKLSIIYLLWLAMDLLLKGH